MPSISYYLALAIIKLKGVKTVFSKHPINYIKLRKEDVHEISSFREGKIRKLKIADSLVTILDPEAQTSHLIIFVPGGAFVSGPVQYHWDASKSIASQTKLTTWVVDYPKAPETKIDVILENIDAVYKKALESYSSKKVIFVGDSVGGTLISALVQRKIAENGEIPGKIILISPVMNADLKDEKINQLDSKDPILSRVGFTSAKKMATLNGNLKDPRISPVHGNFRGFPPTVMFLAENDITVPDQKLAVQKLKDAGVEVKEIIGKEMPHIWPLLPVISEGKSAFKILLIEIKNFTASER